MRIKLKEVIKKINTSQMRIHLDIKLKTGINLLIFLIN